MEFAALPQFLRDPQRNPSIPELPTDTVTIVSVFPKIASSQNYTWAGLGGQGGFYAIPANPPCQAHSQAPCEKCRTYAKLVVGWARQAVDDILAADGSRRRLEMVPAKGIAQSLVVSNCLDRGVFIAKGAEPTEEELDAAYAQYAQWAETEVAEADKQWARKRDVAMINPHALDAAKFLKLTREWSTKTAAMLDCEACGDLIRKGTTICKCGYPVDFQKAYDMGLLNEKLEAFGRKNGKIRDTEAAEEKAVEEVLVAAETEPEKPKGKRHVYG